MKPGDTIAFVKDDCIRFGLLHSIETIETVAGIKTKHVVKAGESFYEVEPDLISGVRNYEVNDLVDQLLRTYLENQQKVIMPEVIISNSASSGDLSTADNITKQDVPF